MGKIKSSYTALAIMALLCTAGYPIVRFLLPNLGDLRIILPTVATAAASYLLGRSIIAGRPKALALLIPLILLQILFLADTFIPLFKIYDIFGGTI